MITIRSSAASSEPTLIALEAVLTTAQGICTISSNSTGADSTSTFSDGLFGAISWPLSRFQLAPGVVLEQQMFCHMMDQRLHSPGSYTLNRPCKGGSQSSRSFLAAAHAPIAMLVSTLTQKRMAVVSPGWQMYADRKLSRIRTANITMNRRDSLSALAIKKQHPLHPKISSHPELSNLS